MSASIDLRIILAGGGTGGHITPLVAVAEQLRSRATLLWLGGYGDLAVRAAREASIDYRAVASGKWRRYWSIENFFSPLWLVFGIIQAIYYLVRFQPQVTFAKGGFVSLPTVLASWLLGVPIVIHESDAVMGWANRWSSHFATKICLSYANTDGLLPAKQAVILTGVPTQSVFAKKAPVRHQFSSRKPQKLLIMGGSQGARAMNRIVDQSLGQLRRRYAITHLTGQADFSHFCDRIGPAYQPKAFISPEKMAEALLAADLVIARASGSALAEIALIGRPAILVPLPQAANHHQQANARVWVRAGAAVRLDEPQLTPQTLLAAIAGILEHRAVWKKMVQAAQSLAQPAAAHDIARLLVRIAKER